MIAIGADHGGYKLKEEIKKYLEESGIKITEQIQKKGQIIQYMLKK